MATDRELPLNVDTIRKFVKLCKSTFGWEDLSEATVMDAGCGKGLYCARALLEDFPDVKSIIALDSDPAQLKGIFFESSKIIRLLGDILNWMDIHPFDGEMEKVISTHALYQIHDQEKAFQNIYGPLKPGGEAAFLFFSDSGLYHLMNNLRQDSTFKYYFMFPEIFEMYSRELKADHYREMLEKVGFKVIEISEEKQFPKRTVWKVRKNCTSPWPKPSLYRQS